MRPRKSQPYIVLIFVVGLLMFGFAYLIISKPFGDIFNIMYDENYVMPKGYFQENTDDSFGETTLKYNTNGNYSSEGIWTDIAKGFDADNDTFAIPAGYGANANINYARPNGMGINAMNWELHLGDDMNIPYEVNVSLPYKCIWQNGFTQLRIETTSLVSNYFCYDGNSYILVYTQNIGNQYLFEEGLWYLVQDAKEPDVYQKFFIRTKTLWEWTPLFAAVAMIIWFLIKAQQSGGGGY
jgi:hypothetical protein